MNNVFVSKLETQFGITTTRENHESKLFELKQTNSSSC